MACDAANLPHYLKNFSGLDPVNAAVCPYAQSGGGGLGLGVPLFTLLVIGPLGLAMSVRAQHPGPVIIAGFLSVGAIAASLPGPAATIAVLAGGLGRVYPSENEPLLARMIDEGGAVLSEMPFSWEPKARDFPRRNRIVSGLCRGVVVVEAAAKSGSLITARPAWSVGAARPDRRQPTP